jgi:hypothetical protein
LGSPSPGREWSILVTLNEACKVGQSHHNELQLAVKRLAFFASTPCWR